MKKISYILASILEICLLAGAYAVHYFTKKKMGMARYVVYKNHKWEKAYPMAAFQMAVVILLVILAILILFFFIKRRRKAKKLAYTMNTAMIALVIIYTVFTIGTSADTMRDHYFISGILALAAFIQEIKTFVTVCGYEK